MQTPSTSVSNHLTRPLWHRYADQLCSAENAPSRRAEASSLTGRTPSRPSTSQSPGSTDPAESRRGPSGDPSLPRAPCPRGSPSPQAAPGSLLRACCLLCGTHSSTCAHMRTHAFPAGMWVGRRTRGGGHPPRPPGLPRPPSAAVSLASRLPVTASESPVRLWSRPGLSRL